MQRQLKMMSWWKTAPFNLFPGRGGITLPSLFGHMQWGKDGRGWGSRGENGVFRVGGLYFQSTRGNTWWNMTASHRIYCSRFSCSAVFHWCHRRRKIPIDSAAVAIFVMENVAVALLCVCVNVCSPVCVCVCVSRRLGSWARAVGVDFDQGGCWEHPCMKQMHHYQRSWLLMCSCVTQYTLPAPMLSKCNVHSLTPAYTCHITHVVTPGEAVAGGV